jgi:hypothetical protein
MVPVPKRDLDELRIGSEPESPNEAGISEALSQLPRTVRGSGRWRTIIARGAAPVLAWFALGLVVFGSQRDTDYDLQLTAAEAAQPNEDLPLRGLLYENLRSVEGPRLSARAIDVQLEDRSGAVQARGKLVPARGGHGDVEGSIQIPASLHGNDYRLHAIVQVDTVRVEVERPLSIGDSARYAVSGRPLRALQQFSEGPLQPESGQIAPDVLRVRVGGGACVPEEECLIFVHVGTPPANVWVEGNSTVTPQAAAAQVAEPRAGVHELAIVTHGPEAQLWLRASRDGVLVAHRSVRLPIALGASALRLKSSIVREGDPLSFQLLGGGEGGCILDVFRDEHWLRTASARSCSQPQRIAALPPGVYRMQARRDPFASATAGVAIAQVISRADRASGLSAELAREVIAFDPTDRFAGEVARGTQADLGQATHDLKPDPGFGYLAAALESGIIELPRAVSGYNSTLERLAHGQAQLRWLSIFALVLGAISLALAVGRSGLRAVARADEILHEAGQTGPVRRRARARSMLSLALSLLSLMLVFVVLGAYVVARGGP